MRFCQKSGFTLIELLVVIAIISVLAAILFPVFGKAREKARQNSCMNNQRQFAQAVMMAAQDHDDRFPDAATAWGQLQLPAKSLKCPSGSQTMSNSYGYNGDLSGVAVAAIGDPTIKLVTADSSGTGQGETPNVLTTRKYIALRHSDRAIASYLDGHVALLSATALPFFNGDPPSLLYTDPSLPKQTSGLPYYETDGLNQRNDLMTAMAGANLTVLMGWPTTATAPVCYPSAPGWIGNPVVTVNAPAANTVPAGVSADVGMWWGPSAMVRGIQGCSGNVATGYSCNVVITPLATVGYKAIGIVFASGTSRCNNAKRTSGPNPLEQSTITVEGEAARVTPHCDPTQQGAVGKRVRVANVALTAVPVTEGKRITITINTTQNSGAAFLAFER